MAAWTQDDIDLVCTMWARGARSTDIVPLLSRQATRNAVMGMVDRLGLMGLGHADRARLARMDRVSRLLGAPFSFGEPLHPEALVTLSCLETGSRDVEVIALSSGMARDRCAAHLARLALVWPEGLPPPARWSHAEEGVIAFVLDMAVVAGRLKAVPRRGATPPVTMPHRRIVPPPLRRPSAVVAAV